MIESDQDTTSNISVLLQKQDSVSLLKEDDSKSQGGGPPVKRLYTENCLFLDVTSLSKSF